MPIISLDSLTLTRQSHGERFDAAFASRLFTMFSNREVPK